MTIDPERLTTCFNESLDKLAKFQHLEISSLAGLMWKLINARMVRTASMPLEHTIAFTIAAQKGSNKYDALVIVPPTLEKMMGQQTAFCLGGFVFVGSQCQDFYNQKFPFQGGGSGDDVHMRAVGYEAEYLLFHKKAHPEYEFNQWQKKVLEKCPKGLESLKELGIFYESKPFVPGAESFVGR